MSQGDPTVRARRAERLQAEQRRRQQAAARERQRRLLLWAGAGAAIILALAIVLVVPRLGGSSSGQTAAPGGTDAPMTSLPPGVPEGVQSYEITDQSHVSTPVQYPQNPPAGGPHAPQWQNCGFYDAPIRAENAVHSMEHGAVWITYQPGLPASEVEKLRQLARQTYVLVSPYPDLPAPIGASAWARNLLVPNADDPQLAEFVRTYRLGPTTPEQGAPCTGGVGQPR